VNHWRKNHWIHRAIGFVCLLAGLASLPLFLAGYQKATVDADIRLNIALVIGAALLSVFGLCALLSGGIKKGFSYTTLISIAAFLMAPFVWMVLISLHPSKTPIPPISELIPRAVEKDSQNQPIMVPGPHGKPTEKVVIQPRWDNYDFVLNHPNLPVKRFFFNTVFVTLAVVMGQLFVTSLAAYAFARLKFKGRELLFNLFLGSMMFAGPVTQIPVYLLIRNLGWLDTYWALIIPGVSSAFSVFLLRQQFLSISPELDEAARMDGAGEFRIYSRIILPLSKAALATAGAFTFFGVWTDFFNPLIYTNSTEMRTLEVGLSIFKNSYGGTNWPLQMTAAVIVMLPLLVVFLFCQRFFVRGVMLGSIK
jgi:multiple sugar transport system permease protein